MPAGQTRTSRASNGVRKSVRVVPSLDTSAFFVSSTPAPSGSASKSKFVALTSPIVSDEGGSPKWISGENIVFKTPKAPSPALSRKSRRSTMVNFSQSFTKPLNDKAEFKSPPGVKTRSRRSSIYVPAATKAAQLKEKKYDTEGLTRVSKTKTRNAAKIKNGAELTPKRAELALSSGQDTINEVHGRESFTKLISHISEDEIKKIVNEDGYEKRNHSKSSNRVKRKGEDDLKVPDIDKKIKTDDPLTNVSEILTPVKTKDATDVKSSAKKSVRSTRRSMLVKDIPKVDSSTETPLRSVSKRSPKKAKIVVDFQDPEIFENDLPLSLSNSDSGDCGITVKEDSNGQSAETPEQTFGVENKENKSTRNTTRSNKEGITWKSPAPKTPQAFFTPTTTRSKLASRRSTPWVKKYSQVLDVSETIYQGNDVSESYIDCMDSSLVETSSPSLTEKSIDAGNATLSHTSLSSRCTIL